MVTWLVARPPTESEGGVGWGVGKGLRRNKWGARCKVSCRGLDAGEFSKRHSTRGPGPGRGLGRGTCVVAAGRGRGTRGEGTR